MDEVTPRAVDFTPEEVQQFFPIMPRDRRENSDLFAPFVENGDLRDDARFYHGVARLLRERVDIVREYDVRMHSRRDSRKAFTLRALRHLGHFRGESLTLRDLHNLDDFRPDDGPAAALLHLLFRLEPKDASEDGDDIEPSIPEQPPTPSDWRLMAAQLAQAASELTIPDSDAVQRIVDLAAALSQACSAAREADAELDGEREALLERVTVADADIAPLAADIIASASRVFLDTITAAVNALEGATEDLSAAVSHWEDLSGQLNRAIGTQEFDDAERLLPMTRKSDARRKEVIELHAAARRRLAGLISGGEGAAAHGSGPSESLAPSAGPQPDPSDEASADVRPGEARPETVGNPENPRNASAWAIPEALTEPVPAELTDLPDQPIGFRAVEVEAPDEWMVRERAPDIPAAFSQPNPPMVPGASEAAVEIDVEALLAHYLSRDELALAWHFADLCEERNLAVSIPAAVLKLAAIAGSFSRPEDASDPLRLEVLGGAASALAAVELAGEARSLELTKAMLAAALVRPALFDLNNVSRSYLSNIALDGRLARFAPLADGLVRLGFEIRIAIEDLAHLAGTARKKRLPAATAALRDWLTNARVRKTVYQPAHRLLRQELAPYGRLGKVCEGLLANSFEWITAARELAKKLVDDRHFIQEAEQQSGRLGRDGIEGKALEWFCERLQECRQHLEDWLEARDADLEPGTDRRSAGLAARIGNLRKLASETASAGAGQSDRLAAAVLGCLDKARNELIVLLDGGEGSDVPRRPTFLLAEPLLRLPGGCQPRCDLSKPFEAERTAQRQRLFHALIAPEVVAPDFERALAARMLERATLAATDIVAILGQRAEPAWLDAKRQELDEIIAATRDGKRKRVEQLRQDLATLMNLELSSQKEVHEDLDRIDLMARALDPTTEDAITLPARNGERMPEVPPDFPELEVELARIEALGNAIRRTIAQDQRERLQVLASRPETAAAAAFVIERMEEYDPVTIDDRIADLQAGRSHPDQEQLRDDDFVQFYPVLCNAINETEQLNRGRVLAAVEQRLAIGPLDFSQHDEHEALSAKRLIEAWAEAENCLRGASVSKLHEAMDRLFGLLGFTGVAFATSRELVPGRLRSLQLSCNVPTAGRWFLPPAFGSEALGSFPVLVARPDIPHEQLASELGRLAPDRASFMLIFGKIGPKGRARLTRALRRDRRVVLAIDESMLLFLATCRGNHMERLFACAMPFGWVQPYTTNPGMIPPEMFFGRRDEIASIISRGANGCLVYGGRQLGKSALLNHVRRLQHRPNEGQVALYLDIKTIGDLAIPADRIWMEIGHLLKEERITTDSTGDPMAIETAIRRWLAVRADRRLLVMLDESDRFLRSEHPVYPNLQRLKSLMESTEWRFKVVFAGLHNVRRMSQAPNSPLVQLGQPICIGPMNATLDNQSEIRRLVVAPMRAAGLEYEPPTLAWDMLSRVNHYPSLVQVFCKSVIESASGQAQAQAAGPRWKLSREALFEGSAGKLIGDEIRKRFQWTLDLDPRYDLLAKCIALHRFSSSEGHAAVLRRGLTVTEVDTLSRPWWPTTVDRPSVGDLEELLREMVDLGVLGTLEPGRFSLRNSHIAQMLGQEDDIERDILALSEREADVDYDAAVFCRRIKMGEGLPRSPLTDRVLAGVFDHTRAGLRIVAVAPVIVGRNVPVRLVELARQWTTLLGAGVSTQLHKGSSGQLRPLIDKAKKGRQLIVIETVWDVKVARWLATHPNVVGRRVLPLWVVPADLTLADEFPSGAQVVRTGPWGDPMLRHWLREEGLNALDIRNMRREIMAVTGGSSERLLAIRSLLQDASPETCQRLGEWNRDHPLRLEDVGLPPDLREPFAEFATFGEIETRGDFLAVFDQRLADAMLALGLAEPIHRDGLRVSPLGRLMTSWR